MTFDQCSRKKTDDEISNIVAEFFNKITEHFSPLTDEHCNEFCVDDRIILTDAQIEKRLIECKKPKSMVNCNVFPDFVKYAKFWSCPLTKNL